MPRRRRFAIPSPPYWLVILLVIAVCSGTARWITLGSRVRVSRCQACGLTVGEPLPQCPNCGANRWREE